MARAYVVTAAEMMEMLERVQTVADRIGEHYQYSQALLERVADTMNVIMNDDREFSV